MTNDDDVQMCLQTNKKSGSWGSRHIQSTDTTRSMLAGRRGKAGLAEIQTMNKKQLCVMGGDAA